MMDIYYVCMQAVRCPDRADRNGDDEKDRDDDDGGGGDVVDVFRCDR